MNRVFVLLSIAFGAALAALSAVRVQAGPITIATVPVGDAGNAADTNGTGLGAVTYAYNIGMYEVTNDQYAAFLTAVGQSTVSADTLLDANSPITWNGSAYVANSGAGSLPVAYVNFKDCARFANWLNNGQGGASTIEAGTYRMTDTHPLRTTGAWTWAVASENEWYKAAYYKGGGTNAGYYSYATSSNIAPTGQAPAGGSNSANLGKWSGYALEPVGSYTSTKSPCGAFDMQGNVSELTDIYPFRNDRRCNWGGDYDDTYNPSSSTYPTGYPGLYEADGRTANDVGFRVVFNPASVPEPGTLALLAASLIGLLCYGWRRQRTLHKLSPLTLAAAVALAAMTAGAAQANVFDMGGTRNPTTGTWTGSASLEFVPVGDPGNAGEQSRLSYGDSTYYGAVGYTYQMGKYDVTVGQYCQFLNAVATTDSYNLYYFGMGTDLPTIAITQSGSSGNYSYAVTGSYDQGVNCPIFDVSWGSAARFCNWLQNGQPTTLGEVVGSTETGAYSLNGAVTNGALMAITRNTGATYFIPSENEWYKAAYYKGGSTNAGYWTYPTRSNTKPSNQLSASGTNNTNYNEATYNLLTPVGYFAGSPGPYGTFDMGGDVDQWHEGTVTYGDVTYFGCRGGGWNNTGTASISNRQGGGFVNEGIGFRVASIVPEPGSVTLVVAGGLCLLAAYAWRRRATA